LVNGNYKWISTGKTKYGTAPQRPASRVTASFDKAKDAAEATIYTEVKSQLQQYFASHSVQQTPACNNTCTVQ